MKQDLLHAATVIENRWVTQWRQAGSKVVGTTCSYVPDELFHAAGLLPYRLRGHAATETGIGDTYFGPFICSLPKCLLQLIGEGRYRFLDGAVITPGCDSMRRLDECWRKAGDDIPGIVPSLFFHFGAPHKYSEYTLKWFTDEIRRLMAALSAHFAVEITHEALHESIRIYNHGRTLLEELERRRSEVAPPILGSEALAAVLAGTAMPREEYNHRLEALLDELDSSGQLHQDKARLMLLGSATDDVELVRLVEGERAVVVGDNLCFGARCHLSRADEEGDPVLALARRYLQQNDCPRVFGGYRQRLTALRERLQAAKVDGVILQNIRFCDLHGAENGLLERDLEAEGIPCLRVEREYGPLVERGRLKLRVDAFLERIQGVRR